MDGSQIKKETDQGRGTDKRISVLWLANIPSPYRVKFFNQLGNFVDLTVLYEGGRASDRDERWKPGYMINHNPIILKGIRTGSDTFFCPCVLAYLKQQWDQIIIGGIGTSTQILAIEWLRKNKKKFIIEVDGGIVRDDAPWKRRLKTRLITSADAWLSSGKATTEYLVHYGADQARCFDYPFTSLSEADLQIASESAQHKEKYRRQLGMVEENIILCVAQMITRKGIDTLLQAARWLEDDVGIYIVGGEPTEEMKEYLGNTELKPDRIHFPGFMEHDEIQKYYCAADTFVLPTREDIWGLVINEAMAYGLPIVTTKRCVAGLTLVKNGENGQIIEPDSPQELAKALQQVLRPEKRKAYSDNSRASIREYTIESMVKAHIQAFQTFRVNEDGNDRRMN